MNRHRAHRQRHKEVQELNITAFMNLMVILVPFLLISLWAFPGIHVFPNELMVPRISTPVGQISPVTLAAVALAVLAHLLLHRTVLGFRIRAVGDHIQTWLNGEKRVDLRDSRTARGFIGLQVHSVKANLIGREVRWRNLKLTDLSAN